MQYTSTIYVTRSADKNNYIIYWKADMKYMHEGAVMQNVVNTILATLENVGASPMLLVPVRAISTFARNIL